MDKSLKVQIDEQAHRFIAEIEDIIKAGIFNEVDSKLKDSHIVCNKADNGDIKVLVDTKAKEDIVNLVINDVMRSKSTK